MVVDSLTYNYSERKQVVEVWLKCGVPVVPVIPVNDSSEYSESSESSESSE